MTQLQEKQARSMSRVCNRERVVWAKVRGYRPWPARIVEQAERELEPSYKQADAFREEGDDVLVVFFGTNEIAWLASGRAVTPWKTGLKRKYHEYGTPPKVFRRGLEEVRRYCTERSGIKFEA